MIISFSSKILNEGAQPPKSLSIDLKNQVSNVYAIDAPASIVYQRGNSRMLIVFEIERAHESEALAAKFALEHSAALNSLSDGELIFFDENNREEILKIDAAVLSSAKTAVEGMYTSTKYQFNQA